jgi:hypothetical protein
MAPPVFRRRNVLVGSGVVAASFPTVARAIDLADLGAQPGEDISAALARGLREGDGAPLALGPGVFKLASPLVYSNEDRLLKSSRAPGLVLLGSGQRSTVIEFTGDGAAAIQVTQRHPYRFTLGGRLEGFTLKGNPRAAQQDGIRLSGAWNYNLKNLDVVDFGGHGLSIPQRDDLRWELDHVELKAGSPILRRSVKPGFSDDSGLVGGMQVFGPGVPAGAVIARIIDENALQMSAPASESGEQSLQFVGNPDAFESIVEVADCRFLNNRGWGVWGGAGVAATISWTRSEAALNHSGGVFCAGNGWLFQGGAIYSNTGIGLVVDRVFGGPQILKAERVEFDSNSEAHVWLKEISTAVFERCRFLSHYFPDQKANRPEIGLIIGNDPATRLTRGVELKGCQFRAPPNNAANFAGIRFGAPGSYRNIEFVDCPWIARAPHHRFFDNDPHPSGGIAVREEGVTARADRTQRAWTVMEKNSSQKIPSGERVQVLFERVQGALAGGASAHRIVRAAATQDNAEFRLDATQDGLKPGMPVTEYGGTSLPPDSVIVVAQGDRLQASSTSSRNGDLRLLVGGLRIPYSQPYRIDATLEVTGATPATTLELALTVDGRLTRRTIVPGSAIERQTLSLQVLLPLERGARIDLHLRHDAPGEIVVSGSPAAGTLSLIAAT